MKSMKLQVGSRQEEPTKKKISFNIDEQHALLFMFTLVLLFIFMIGFIIPFMESRHAYFMAIELIPVVLVFMHVFIKVTLKNQKAREQREGLERLEGRLEIVIKGRKYVFLKRKIALYFLSIPFFVLFFIFFMDLEINDWLGEIVAKQSAFLLNDVFHVGVKIAYAPGNPSPWYLLLNSTIFVLKPGCVGAQAWGLITGLTVFAPSSEFETKKDYIVWRKTKYIVVAVILGHLTNIIRLFIQVYVTSLGYDAFLVHKQLADITAALAGLLFIVYLLYRWVPEVFISVFYALKLAKKSILLQVHVSRELKPPKETPASYTWHFISCIAIFIILVIIAIFYVFA